MPGRAGCAAPQLINGFCVYNVGPVTQDQCPRGYGPVSFGPIAGCAGASNSFIAAQALSRTSEAITQAYTDLINERIKRRRDQDRLGRLQQFAGAARMDYAADLPSVRKPTVSVAAPSGPRPAIWVQAYGDFERRNETQIVGLAQRVQVLDLSTRSHTGGVAGGIDILLPGVLGADGFLLGLTGGYADTTIKSRNMTEQRLTVATVGLYGAWIRGNFALGFNAKTDFVDMRQTFSDFVDSAPFPPVLGGFSLNGHNYSIGGTASYRFDLGASGWYIEPTVGLDYTRSTYKDGQRYGIANGTVLRGRAGAIAGTTIALTDTMALQPTFGLFAYSDLSVQSDGGALLFFDVNSLQPASRTDQGKLRGEVQAGFNLISSGGLSFNARGEYRFGEDLRGGAVRAGLRYQF